MTSTSADPGDLPCWAPVVARSVWPDGDTWILEMPQDPIRPRVAACNEHGLLLFTLLRMAENHPLDDSR